MNIACKKRMSTQSHPKHTHTNERTNTNTLFFALSLSLPTLSAECINKRGPTLAGVFPFGKSNANDGRQQMSKSFGPFPCTHTHTHFHNFGGWMKSSIFVANI